MKYYFLLVLSVLFISCSDDSEPTEEDVNDPEESTDEEGGEE